MISMKFDCDKTSIRPAFDPCFATPHYSTFWLRILSFRQEGVPTALKDRIDKLAMTASLDAIFAALADPTRRAILAMLLEDDMAVTDVADPFEMSLAAISKHLGVLERAGLIVQEKRGRLKWCKLEPSALKQPSVWMQGFGQFDPVNLDDFERFLAAEVLLVRRDAAEQNVESESD